MDNFSVNPNASSGPVASSGSPRPEEVRSGNGEGVRRNSRSRSRSGSRSPHRRRGSHSRSKSPRGSRSRSPRRSRSRSRSKSRDRGGRREKDHPTPPPNNCLGVFGLSGQTTQDDLKTEFGKFGELEKVDLIIDKRTGQSRCYGFIYFKQVEDATKAKNAMNGNKLHGKEIRTDYSLTDRAHESTPGTYKGKVTRPRNRRYGQPYRSRRHSRSRSRSRSRDRYHDDRDRYRDRDYRGSRDRYYDDRRDSRSYDDHRDRERGYRDRY